VGSDLRHKNGTDGKKEIEMEKITYPYMPRRETYIRPNGYRNENVILFFKNHPERLDLWLNHIRKETKNG